MRTIKSNKRFIPSSFVANTQLYNSDFAFLKEVMLVSYQSKKKQKVHLLSTMHDVGNVGDDKMKKPEVVTYYNETKAGVDTLDQMTHAYTTKPKTKRWPVVMFFNMLDISGIAAFILWSYGTHASPQVQKMVVELTGELQKNLLYTTATNIISWHCVIDKYDAWWIPVIYDKTKLHFFKRQIHF